MTDDHTAEAPVPMVSVYAGKICVGFVLARGPRGFEAFTVDQHSIGMFPTLHEGASAALSWDGESWEKAANDYHAKRGRSVLEVETPPDRLRDLRQLLDPAVSIDRAYSEINSLKGRATAVEKTTKIQPPPKTIQPRPASATATDLLSEVIERVRPLLMDAATPTKKRIQILWGAAKIARGTGADDVIMSAFMALAVETNLIDKRGHWTGTDVRDYVCRHGREDVEHVITWALRGWNPFE